MPSSAAPLRVFPSFPTRRSSDLGPLSSARPPNPRAHGLFAQFFQGENFPDGPSVRQLVIDEDSIQRPLNTKRMWFDSIEVLSQGSRSEEHTSELQSPCNLVCRPLLRPSASSPLSLHAALPIWVRYRRRARRIRERTVCSRSFSRERISRTVRPSDNS